MSQNIDDVSAEIRKTLDRMSALRDQVKVKIHLASMDVRDGWNRLEPKIQEAEQAATDASKAALHTIQATAKKLEDLVASL